LTTRYGVRPSGSATTDMLDTEHVSTSEAQLGNPWPMGGRTAIVVALAREVAPLVKGWSEKVLDYGGREFEIFENRSVIVVCGGIGAEAARRACEAAIAIYHPGGLVSAGFAGALTASQQVGDVVIPEQIVDVRDGSRFNAVTGEGRLVSFSEIASQEQKASLAKAYEAKAVDMEAASVARSAQIHGVGFMAVKAISDEVHETLPDMRPFIEGNGEFRVGRLVTFAAVRPWLWPRLFMLARNSAKASKALCRALQPYVNMWVSQIPAPHPSNRD